MNSLRFVLVVGALAILGLAVVFAATQGPAASHSREDVVRIFAVQGYKLVDDPGVTGAISNVETIEALLLPKSKEPFWVYVGRSDAETERYYRSIARLALPPETFDLLEGNVVVSSDSGLGAKDRRRVRAAMQLLREPTYVVASLEACGKPEQVPKPSGITVKNVGQAGGCIILTPDGKPCETWDTSSFREDGSAVSWVPEQSATRCS